jgi:predicted alpha-1,2-mannosidase
MVQMSPDTEDSLWGMGSGYNYADASIMGFSCTHLSGTGIPDLGDFLFVPEVGEPKLTAGDDEHPGGYRQAFRHEDESASCGHYKVTLANGVTTELAAAEHAGILRFAFPGGGDASILIDLAHLLHGKKFKVVWSHVRVPDASTVTGFHLVNGWGKERYLYFAARYSVPWADHVIVSDGKPQLYDTYRFRSRNEASGANLQFIARYGSRPLDVSVRVGISAVSEENALANLEADIPSWDFDRVVTDARERWERELEKIEVDAPTEDKETFYTSLYHAFLAPNVYEDVNGEYRGLDHGVHKATGFTRYAVFSLWDTFRAEHPLLSLIQARRDSDMVQSMLAHFDQSVDHLLPVWELDGTETWCMIGYHSVPVIVDAYLKGVGGFDPGRAYAAIRATATNQDYDSVARYAERGWVPYDKENESLSKTLEYAFDDFSIAQMARRLGKVDDYRTFMRRSESFRNLFDPQIGWMRPRAEDGTWRHPFDPHDYGGDTAKAGDITEGTSAQYSWSVPHDVPALIELMGGKKRFVEKLDALFDYKGAIRTGEGDEMQGRIGEYWHGNEPSHHIAYLYSMAGEPGKTAERVHQIVRTQYGNKPDSLSGNDDCGQMSAWYLFSALGFYPVCPTCDSYVIGSPSVSRAVVHLSNGKALTITAEGLSETRIYVQAVSMNGAPLDSPILPYATIKDGGTLVFTMGKSPSLTWGREAEASGLAPEHE